MKPVLLLLIGLVLLGGCSAMPGQAPTLSSPPSAELAPGSPEAERRGTAPAPVAVDIPKIKAHSTLVPLGVNQDDTIEVPPVSKPWQAGWYRFGPVPGEAGPAVILGHVDGNKQQGIFFHLKELVPGDQVSIARADGSSIQFTVTRVDQVAKDLFPTEAVYGDTAGAELRLITCGGVFDRAARSYEDNIIVYAVLG